MLVHPSCFFSEVLVNCPCSQIFTLSFARRPVGILYMFWILMLWRVYVLRISLPSLNLFISYAIFLYTQIVNTIRLEL